MGWFGNNASLDKIDRDVSAVADGNADLSHTIGTSANDAAGRISSNINRFYGRVCGLISHARERSVSIASDAARMNHLVQQTDDAVRRQEALASDVFESSNRVNMAVGEVATNSDAIQASTKNKLDLAQRSLKLSRMPLSEFVMQSRVARSLEGMKQDDYTVLVNEATSASLRWAQDGIIGWDWARYVHLLRLAFLAEVLDSDESWKLLKNLEQPIKSRFKNWDSFGKSYLNGRTFWQGTASPMDDVISRLNTDPWSPWKKFGWL